VVDDKSWAMEAIGDVERVAGGVIMENVAMWLLC
jgi:hypothetical protein